MTMTEIENIIKTNAEKFYPEVRAYFTSVEDFEALMKAVIKRESNFNPKDVMAETNVNDFSIGLCQVRVQTGKWMLNMYSKTDDEMYKMLFEPSLNVYVGMKYLTYLLKRYEGNYPLAIASYNSGTAKIKDGGYVYKSSDYHGETLINQGYVNDILKYWENFSTEKKSPLMTVSVAFGLLLGVLSIWIYNKIGR